MLFVKASIWQVEKNFTTLASHRGLKFQETFLSCSPPIKTFVGLESHRGGTPCTALLLWSHQRFQQIFLFFFSSSFFFSSFFSHYQSSSEQPSFLGLCPFLFPFPFLCPCPFLSPFCWGLYFLSFLSSLFSYLLPGVSSPMQQMHYNILSMVICDGHQTNSTSQIEANQWNPDMLTAV